MFGTIILFIAVLSILVFVHEFGHFITAKKMGMKVEEFGFGFPPRLFKYRPKNSETLYTINAIPVGGFVKIKGESGEHAGEADSFASKSAPKRFSVLIAGVAMNIILAWVLLSIGFMLGLPSVIDDQLPKSASVKNAEMIIASVVPESPAARAQIEPGDELLSIDGQVFDSAEAARDYIGSRGGEGIELSFAREGEDAQTVALTSEQLKDLDQSGVGIGILKTGLVSFPVHIALVQGFTATGQFTYEVAKAFAELLGNLVSRGEVSVDLSGPVGIAVLTGQVASLGFVYLLQFTALLSINLAIINVLPFPALDGGRILFLLIEKVRGKAIDVRVEALAHNLGFALLMVLVILVTYRDFVRFGDQIFGTFRSLLGG